MCVPVTAVVVVVDGKQDTCQSLCSILIEGKWDTQCERLECCRHIYCYWMVCQQLCSHPHHFSTSVCMCSQIVVAYLRVLNCVNNRKLLQSAWLVLCAAPVCCLSEVGVVGLSEVGWIGVLCVMSV